MNKDELLARIAEHICETMPVEQALSDPRREIIEVLYAYRQLDYLTTRLLNLPKEANPCSTDTSLASTNPSLG